MNKPIEIKATNGLRNDISEERYEVGDLSVAQNVETDETGKLRRRLGFSLKTAGAWHSLFSCGEYAYGVRDGMLSYVDSLGAPIPLVSVSGPVSYAKAMDHVFWSDYVNTGVLVGASNRDWGMIPPQFTVQTLDDGQLREGRYLISVVFVDGHGRESGARRAATVSTSGGVRVYVGATLDPQVVKARVYATTWNGELLYAAGECSPGSTLDIVSAPSTTMPLRTTLMTPPPPGQVVGVYAGRSYVAKNNHLWYSQPHEYELFDLAASYLTVSDGIRLFAPVANGVFLGTDSEILFLSGTDPAEFTYLPVAQYGALQGSLTYVPNPLALDGQPRGLLPMWFSKRGACLGMEDGQLVNLTADRIVMPSGVTRGASLLKVRGGTPCLVSSLS